MSVLYSLFKMFQFLYLFWIKTTDLDESKPAVFDLTNSESPIKITVQLKDLRTICRTKSNIFLNNTS